MVTFLFTSILLLGFLAIAFYFWQKPSTKAETEALQSPALRGLFGADAEQSTSHPHTSDGTGASLAVSITANRIALIERAKNGEKSALDEAQKSNDVALYDQLLDSLVERADSDAKLLSLVSYITQKDLPVNEGLAAVVIESWKRAPDRSSTAKALHIAALSDDAIIYRGAVETALQLWRDRKLPGASADELRALFEGEFWILSSRTRRSGAGFRLKRTLARARRKLQVAERVD